MAHYEILTLLQDPPPGELWPWQKRYLAPRWLHYKFERVPPGGIKHLKWLAKRAERKRIRKSYDREQEIREYQKERDAELQAQREREAIAHMLS